MPEHSNGNIRVGWLATGEQGGVVRAVRGLTGAARALGINPMAVSLRDGAFAKAILATGTGVRTPSVYPLPVIRGGLVISMLPHLKARRQAGPNCGVEISRRGAPRLI